MKIITNDIKPITILLKEKDLASVKAILKFLNERYSKFSVMKFRTGKIGEDILVSFKVSGEFYPKVLEKFAYNDIPIIMKDKSSQEFIDKKKEHKRKKLQAQGWSEITIDKRQISLSELIELSSNGKIKEVAKEAKGGVNSNITIVNKAKELLTETINIAIENLVKYAEVKLSRSQEAIDQLLLIATDKDLKLFHKNVEISQAGLAAIELSLSHKNYYDNLIKIANHPKLNNLTNIRATVAFADLYFTSSEKELEQFPDVIRLLNTRWLKIAFETIQHSLSIEEVEQFNHFIQFIENKRKAA
jgi:hypothetical protein